MTAFFVFDSDNELICERGVLRGLAQMSRGAKDPIPDGREPTAAASVSRG